MSETNVVGHDQTADAEIDYMAFDTMIDNK